MIQRNEILGALAGLALSLPSAALGGRQEIKEPQRETNLATIQALRCGGVEPLSTNKNPEGTFQAVNGLYYRASLNDADSILRVLCSFEDTWMDQLSPEERAEANRMLAYILNIRANHEAVLNQDIEVAGSWQIFIETGFRNLSDDEYPKMMTILHESSSRVTWALNADNGLIPESKGKALNLKETIDGTIAMVEEARSDKHK